MPLSQEYEKLGEKWASDKFAEALAYAIAKKDGKWQPPAPPKGMVNTPEDIQAAQAAQEDNPFFKDINYWVNKIPDRTVPSPTDPNKTLFQQEIDKLKDEKITALKNGVEPKDTMQILRETAQGLKGDFDIFHPLASLKSIVFETIKQAAFKIGGEKFAGKLKSIQSTYMGGVPMTEEVATRILSFQNAGAGLAASLGYTDNDEIRKLSQYVAGELESRANGSVAPAQTVAASGEKPASSLPPEQQAAAKEEKKKSGAEGGDHADEAQVPTVAASGKLVTAARK